MTEVNMLRKSITYFNKSIRNKLIVTLPLAITVLLGFLFTLTVLSLRSQVISAADVSIDKIIFTQTVTLVVIGVVAVFSVFVIVVSICHLVSDPVKKLAEEAEHMTIHSDKLQPLSMADRADEVGLLSRKLNDLIATINAQQKELIESKIVTETGKVASQVAHDVRSPLSALKIAVQQLETVPEEMRVLIRSAVQRIDDIANDLASKKSQQDEKSKMADEKFHIFLLSGLIESIVSEKRVQYRSRLGLSIESALDKSSYGLFAKVKANEFKRVLSNLINNAVEAISRAGKVVLSMRSENHKIFISVTDNGKGIDADTLPKLMSKGATFGKVKGSGLGLYHAKETLKEFYGDIEIKSEFGKGTVVIITLPRVEAPEWFFPQMKLDSSSNIVILDDDESIHQIWNGRLDSAGISRDNVYHFTAPEDLILWAKAHDIRKMTSRVSHHLFLCDYELLGSGMNGLQVIEELGVAQYSVLVTSRFEEKHVRQDCDRLGVKLLPKNLAGFVPIIRADEPMGQRTDEFKVQSDEQRETRNESQGTDHLSRVQSSDEPPITKYDVVLIDDDPLIHTMWKFEAKKCGCSIKTYTKPDDFLSEIDQFDKETDIYVDSNLGNDVKGEEVSKEIYSKGFKRIYLATGYKKEEFPEMPWIKDILGKNPPFQNN